MDLDSEFLHKAHPHNTLILRVKNHFAHYCKTLIHPQMNSILRKRSTVEQIREKLFNHNPQATRNAVAHQINRTFRHFHSDNLRPMIRIYFSLFLKMISEEEAKIQLVKHLKDENQTATLQKSDTWDRPIIAEFATNVQLQNALHDELVALKDKVVLIEWSSEWLNEYFFFCYDKGPGHYMLTPGKDNKTPVYQNRNGYKLHVTDIFGDPRQYGTHGIYYLSRDLSMDDYIDMIKLKWMLELAPKKVKQIRNETPALNPMQSQELKRYIDWIEKKFKQDQIQWKKEHPDVCYDYIEPCQSTPVLTSDSPYFVRLSFLSTGVMDACHMGGCSPCWICGDPGHRKKECPVKKPYCTECGERGHLAAACADQRDENGACALCGDFEHDASQCDWDQNQLDNRYNEWDDEGGEDHMNMGRRARKTRDNRLNRKNQPK